MINTRFLDNTEEAFVLANLKEFVKLWGSGKRAHLQLECQNGQACIKFSSQLGAPADRHFSPHAPQHGIHDPPQHQHPHQPRRKGPRQRERDRARAAAHRARMSSQDNDSADPAVAKTPSGALTAGTTSLPSTRASSTASADGPGPRNSLPPATSAAAVVPPELVNDEVCPDTEYDSEDVDTRCDDGKTAFRCFQCRILHLPADHSDGNLIVNYNLCRRHIGVYKCESCARVIVGLARIRCHRQVCQHSA